jgi:hypothetical protein
MIDKRPVGKSGRSPLNKGVKPAQLAVAGTRNRPAGASRTAVAVARVRISASGRAMAGMPLDKADMPMRFSTHFRHGAQPDSLQSCVGWRTCAWQDNHSAS